MQHEITAEIAGPRNAQLLDTVIGALLLRVNRLAFVAGTPHHYVSIMLSPSRSRVLMSQTAANWKAATAWPLLTTCVAGRVSVYSRPSSRSPVCTQLGERRSRNARKPSTASSPPMLASIPIRSNSPR